MKLKNYPKEFEINGEIWKTKFVRCVPGYDKSVLGLCCPSEHTIYIRLGQKPKERLVTWVHEKLHALSYSYDFELNHPVIEKLEMPLAELIWDNVVLPLQL